MDFDWTEEQRGLREWAVALGRGLPMEDLAERDRGQCFSRSLWDRCASEGLLTLGVPAAYHSRPERDFLTAILIMEGFGYGCPDNGLAFAVNAHVWTVQLPVVHFGTDEQKARFLPRMAGGEWIGAHALSEPETGSDGFRLATRAEPVDGGYRLTGVKKFISLGPVADVFLVFANVRPEAGPWGVTAFLVERDCPGLRVGGQVSKLGLRTVPMGELHLEGCTVPASNRLGAEGAGVGLSNASLEWERCTILASQLGAMERQLERVVERARTRRQFGQPIGRFQSVSNRVADMKLRLETSRLLLYKTAWLKQRGRSAMLEAAMVKLQMAEAFLESSMAAVRTFGGDGFLEEHGVERDLRDAVGGVLYAGTSDIQRNIIARLLGL